MSLTGVYGRLDGKGVFATTVTNVDPTAKQSQVLHPYVYCCLAPYLTLLTNGAIFSVTEW